MRSLAENIDNKNWIIFDCRFSLGNTSIGVKTYRQGHIPKAHYVHLDKDLSSMVTSSTGRHPLPNMTLFTQKLGHWGVDHSSQIVVYDDTGGAFAGRLWWLLRYLGHINVAVLDGGIQYWKKMGHPITTRLPKPNPSHFQARGDDTLWLSSLQLENKLAQKHIKLIDARTPERFQGKQEPIDPVAGHVPRAVNRPFQLNLAQDGCFKPALDLRAEFTELLEKYAPEQVVHMCGSGVTACHNVLAMEHAGLTGSKLYAGSWSEWIINKNRAVACCA